MLVFITLAKACTYKQRYILPALSGHMQEFPNFEPLTIEHAGIRSTLISCEPETSEMCFGSMIIWQDTYPAYISKLGKAYIIAGDEAFLKPVCTGKGEELAPLVNAIEQECMRTKKPTLFKYVPLEFANLLGRMGYNVNPDRDNWDYVYLTEHLANLPGQKYYSKRKDIKKFMDATGGKAEFVQMQDAHLQACLELNKSWLETKEAQGDAYAIAEHKALEKCIQHFKVLEFTGYVVELDGMVCGFTIAEQLNKSTVVVHFEKGDYRIPGIYQYINNAFARAMLDKYTYINREQDLGLPGLRKAKTSYGPVRMIEKFTCVKPV